jgi:hypothetical protein
MGRKSSAKTSKSRKDVRSKASPLRAPAKAKSRAGGGPKRRSERDSAAPDQVLTRELSAMLAGPFPDIAVEIAHVTRWGRPSVSFQSDGFRGLLPEERFHRLTLHIPEKFRTSRLAGFVWLELVPGETIDQMLKLPRSEDVKPRERAVYHALCDVKYFDALQTALGRSPEKRCHGDFAASLRVLAAARLSAGKIADARLVFIRHGAYCDCQVLKSVKASLAALYADAA